MKNLQIRPLWWLVLVVGGFLISLSFAVRFVREEGQRVKRLAAARDELEEMRLGANQRLKNLSESLEGTLVPPAELLADWNSQGLLRFSDAKMRELPEAFRHHAEKLRLESFPAADLPDLLSALENASPPWRVTSLRLSPTGMLLNGELLLEALDKVPPEL